MSILDKMFGIDAATNSINASNNQLSTGLNKSQSSLYKALGEYEPMKVIGQNALSRLNSYLNGTANIQQDLLNDSNYQAMVEQGLNAVNNSASANGTLRSGATAQALYNQGQSMANQYYQNKLSGLSSLANYANTAANANSSLYNNLSNLYNNYYNNLAQSEIERGKLASTSAQNKTDFFTKLGTSILGSLF